MSISMEQAGSLRILLSECTEFEGRYYVLHLLELLKHSSKSEEELQPIAIALTGLMQNIKALKALISSNQENKAEEIDEKIQAILDNYATLVKATQDQGVFYPAKKVLWFLGYLVLGTLGLVFGGIIGFSLGLCNTLYQMELSSDPLAGFFVGLFFGYVLGCRLLEKGVQKEEDRVLFLFIKHLGPTLESLSLLEEVEQQKNQIKAEFLEHYFKGNQEEFDAFLETPTPYQISTILCSFDMRRLKGTLGHHCLISFKIEEATLHLQLGVENKHVKRIQQTEERMTSGKNLISMLALHKTLESSYAGCSNENKWASLKRYDLVIADCHSYINQLLASVDEPSITVTRFTTTDTLFGRWIGRSLQFVSPAFHAQEYDEEGLRPPAPIMGA